MKLQTCEPRMRTGSGSCVKFRGLIRTFVTSYRHVFKMVCGRRASKTFIFFGLILVTLLFIAYNTYFIIATYFERREICEKLNDKYKKCDSVKTNPKRAIFQDLLEEWIKLADTNNINYVLSSGSLLGQYRNEDVIPWDIDVDVMLQDTLISKLQEITTPRNFTQGSDNAFHFVVQPDYLKPSQRRWNCNGQVRSSSKSPCCIKIILHRKHHTLFIHRINLATHS